MPRPVTDVETDREALVQTLPCPTCGAEPYRDCFYGLDKRGFRITRWTSHTGRYNAAVAAGLVPEMAGSHGAR